MGVINGIFIFFFKMFSIKSDWLFMEIVILFQGCWGFCFFSSKFFNDTGFFIFKVFIYLVFFGNLSLLLYLLWGFIF